MRNFRGSSNFSFFFFHTRSGFQPISNLKAILQYFFFIFFSNCKCQSCFSKFCNRNFDGDPPFCFLFRPVYYICVWPFCFLNILDPTNTDHRLTILMQQIYGGEFESRRCYFILLEVFEPEFRNQFLLRNFVSFKLETGRAVYSYSNYVRTTILLCQIYIMYEGENSERVPFYYRKFSVEISDSHQPPFSLFEVRLLRFYSHNFFFFSEYTN